MSMADLDTDRAAMNSAIQNYKTTLAGFKAADGTTQTDVDNARVAAEQAGKVYADRIQIERKANPGLVEDDFFSNPMLMTSARRSDVASLMLAGGATPTSLFDDFLNGVDAGLWDIIDNGQELGPEDQMTVANSILTIANYSGETGSANQEYGFFGLISKIAFPVGTSIKVRARVTSGRHAALLGFTNGPVTSPFLRLDGDGAGLSWYGRSAIQDTVAGSLKDENGTEIAGLSITGTPNQFHEYEIRRTSATQVVFYLDGAYKHIENSAVFNDDYKVFFGCDSWSEPTAMEIDWIDVQPLV